MWHSICPTGELAVAFVKEAIMEVIGMEN